MKTAILNIAPGKTVDYHGEPCLVLEHRKDGTLIGPECEYIWTGSGPIYENNQLIRREKKD